MGRKRQKLGQQDDINKSLWQLRNQTENKYCAECQTKDPQWVSLNIGVFICLACSGVHREMGTHVSVVKSVEMDRWDRDMLKQMKKKGNEKVNAYHEKYLHLYPKACIQRPSNVSEYEERSSWIMRKYIDKKFTKEPEEKGDDEKSEVNDEDECVRLCDYFVVFERGPLKGEPQKTLFEAEFDVDVVDRYPLEDFKDCPLSPAVGMFVFPDSVKLSTFYCHPQYTYFVLTNAEGVKQYGVAIIFWERMQPMEVVTLVSEAVSSEAKASKEEYPRDVFTPKCLCILSRWPFFDSFMKFLKVLYRISISESPLPIERYISHFIREIPVPPAGRVQVNCVIGDQLIELKRSPINTLPGGEVRFMTLFQCLSTDKVVQLFTAFVTEQKIILVSRFNPVLVEVAETLNTLIFPMEYQGVYMPVLPRKLIDFLYAPVPFIAGVAPAFLGDLEDPDGVVIVNLDENHIEMLGCTSLPHLPDKDQKKLQTKLRQYGGYFNVDSKTNDKVKSPSRIPGMGKAASPSKSKKVDLSPLDRSRAPGDAAFPPGHDIVEVALFGTDGSMKQTGKDDENVKLVESQNSRIDGIQSAFLRFWTSVLKNYRSYLRLENGKTVFETGKFIDDAPDSATPFLLALSETQLWARFVNERTRIPLNSPALKDIDFGDFHRRSTVGVGKENDNHPTPEVLLFDELVKQKLNRSKITSVKAGHHKTPFINDDTHHINNTFTAAPPNTSGLPQQERWKYESFPKLDLSLVGIVRPARLLISKTELNRQARVNSQIRSNNLVVPAFVRLTAQENKSKWSQLNDAVVMVQKNARRYMARKRYTKNLAIIRMMQQRFRYLHTRRKIIIIQRFSRQWLERRSEVYAERKRAIRHLQSSIRTKLAQRTLRNGIRSCKIVQSFARTRIAQQSLIDGREAIRFCQSKCRMKLVRSEFLQTRNWTIRLQALYRGRRVRNHQFADMGAKIDTLRTNIVDLWSELHVSVLYRSKYWIVFQKVGFLNYAIHRNEVERLNDLKNVRAGPQGIRLDADAIKIFSDEKVTLYGYLKHKVEDNVKNKIYEEFGVDIRGRKRKQKLMDLIWQKGKEDVSALAILTISGTAQARVFSGERKQGDLDLVSPLNSANLVEFKRLEYIRRNMLVTLQTSLVSLQHFSQENIALQQKYKVMERENEKLRQQLAMLQNNNCE